MPCLMHEKTGTGRVSVGTCFRSTLRVAQRLGYCIYWARPPAQVHHPNAVQFLGACTKQEPYILVTGTLPPIASLPCTAAT